MSNPKKQNENTDRNLLPSDFLGAVKLFERIFFLIGFVSFYIVGVSNSISHTKFRTNSSYHTLTCETTDKCVDSEGTLLLNEHDTHFEKNIAWFHATFILVIFCGAFRLVLPKLCNNDLPNLDNALRMIGFWSLFGNFYILSSLIMRSSHMLDWTESDDGAHLNYLQSVVSSREHGHNTVIEGYHVSNETSVMGDHKNSYNFFVVALCFFVSAQIVSTIGCFKKEVDTAEKKSFNVRSYVKTTWKEGLLKFMNKKSHIVVTNAIKIAILVLSTIVFADVKEFKASDLEILVQRTTHNEFETDSNYFTVYIKDTFPRANYTNYTAWNETGLDVRNHSTDVSLVQTHIYAKSNTCQSTEDSIVTIKNLRWVYGTLAMAQLAALLVRLVIEILYKCFEKKMQNSPTVKSVIQIMNFLMNIHTLAILVVSFVYYWKFIHNAQSTSCQRSGLMNSNKIDNIYKNIYWITVLCLTVLYDSVQTMNTDKGSNGKFSHLSTEMVGVINKESTST